MSSVPKAKRFVTKRHTRRPYLRMQVSDQDGNDYDLTGATSVTFNMTNEDRTLKVSSAGSVVSPPSSGILQYAWAEGDTDTAGDFAGEFDVYFGAEKMTLPLEGSILITIYEDEDNA